MLNGRFAAAFVVALMVPAVFMATPMARSHDKPSPARSDEKRLRAAKDKTDRHLHVVPASAAPEAVADDRLAEAVWALSALLASLPVGDALWPAVAGLTEALGWRLTAPAD